MENRARNHTSYSSRIRTRKRSAPNCRKSGSHGIWVPTVPSWEKEFCSKVGLLPWEKILEAKKYTNLYPNIMEWDDLACKEAFHSAKQSFWAKLNGLRFNNITMPSPDIYIDEIDWNAETNPELLSGLEAAADEVVKEEKQDNDEKENQNNALYSYYSHGCIFTHPLGERIEPTGWDVVYTEEMARTNFFTGLIVGH